MSEKESLGTVKTRVAVLLGVGAIRYTSYNMSNAIFYVIKRLLCTTISFVVN